MLYRPTTYHLPIPTRVSDSAERILENIIPSRQKYLIIPIFFLQQLQPSGENTYIIYLPVKHMGAKKKSFYVAITGSRHQILYLFVGTVRTIRRRESACGPLIKWIAYGTLIYAVSRRSRTKTFHLHNIGGIYFSRIFSGKLNDCKLREFDYYM